MDAENKREILLKNPYENASWFSKTIFVWAWNFMRKFLKGQNILQNSYAPPSHLQSDHLEKKLRKQMENWFQKKTNLQWILIRLVGKDILISGILTLTKQGILYLFQFELLYLLLSSLNNENDKNSSFQLYGSALMFILISLFTTPVVSHIMFMGEIAGAKLRIALSATIFKKILRLSTAQMKHVISGQLLNIFISDVTKFEEIGRNCSGQIFVPLIVVGNFVYLYFQVGFIGCIGILLILLLTIPTMALCKLTKTISKKKAYLVDDRLKLIREVVSEIRIVKLMCWEENYIHSIEHIRNQELQLCFYGYLIKTIYYSLSFIGAPFAICVILYLMLALNIPVNAPTVYNCYITLVMAQLLVTRVFVRAIDSLMTMVVYVKRIEKLLLFEEYSKVKLVNEKNMSVKDMCCCWDEVLDTQNANIFLLNNVNIVFPSGVITMVTGPVGGGKSTLLLALINEVHIHRGLVNMIGSFTYLPQEPWLFSATIRQNILFGLPFDQERYETTLNSCALVHDLSLLPFGDSTTVDDKGLTLSGGQKARLALARAMYRQSDIYLLDDPLSAVDVKVGNYIWQHCFMVARKTIILVSHCVQFMTASRFIVFVDNGAVTCGTYSQIKDQLLDHNYQDIVQEIAEDDNTTETYDLLKTIKSKSMPNINKKVPARSNILLFWKTAWKFLNGWGAILLITALSVFTQSTNLFYSFYFINLVQNEEHSIQKVQYLFYTLGVETVLRMIQLFVFFYICLRTSRNIHSYLLNSTIKTKLSFFHTHSTGQIISRFSKDIEIVDDILPAYQAELLISGLVILNSLIIACYSNTFVLAIIAVCMTMLFFNIAMYKKTAFPFKFKEASARSHIYSYMNSSLDGTAIIRSHEMQEKATEEMNFRQDQHSAVWFLIKGMCSWTSFICDLLGTLINVSIIILSLFLPKLSTTSRIGMGITNTSIVGPILNMFGKHITDLDLLFHAVYHIYKYIELPPEEFHCSFNSVEKVLHEPQSGRIVFKNVSLLYGDEVEALKNVSFDIRAFEKIGIVGRTGAGKTSLISALFRLTEYTGSIIVDGKDIKTIPLAAYRQKLSIIPQNPVILSGSIRCNLDPKSEFKDENLWNVLESVQLKEIVNKMKFGLEDEMNQFSVGQKQLFCLARTLLHQSQIIVLDEATSNVDNKTDQCIQQLIKSKFSNSTILVIAHRLQTVLDLDRIMVMQSGQIVEFDNVSVLLSKPQGIFKSMVEKAKIKLDLIA